MSKESAVSEAFVEFADTLVRDFDVLDFMHTIAVRCVELLEVDAVGLMLTDMSRLRVVAASTEEVRLLELFEIQNDEGPCIEAFRTGTSVSEADLERSDRWPAFRVEALEAGFRSVDAVPMRLRDEVIGAVNLFRRPTGALASSDLILCQALADVATIGLLQERVIREGVVLADQLQSALNNRVVIEQAKGIIGERRSVDMDAAFELMRSYARSRNLRLQDVARDVISGTVPTEELGQEVK